MPKIDKHEKLKIVQNFEIFQKGQRWLRMLVKHCQKNLIFAKK